MPKEFSRTRRVAEQLQRELAALIRDELKDPRIGMVTVNAVEVSRDLSHARVFVTVMESERRDESIESLNHAAAFLRHELGNRLHLRTIPHLRFVYDESVERGARISSLIDEALSDDENRGGREG